MEMLLPEITEAILVLPPKLGNGFGIVYHHFGFRFVFLE